MEGKMILHRDHFQNFKRYSIPPAQLVIADIPYNVGANAYGSNPAWYKDGNRANGESELAGKQFFNTDKNFNINEFFHFCGNLIKKEPKEKNHAGCMIVFCEFEQQFGLIALAKKYSFPNYINLVFRKNFSAQVLKANMRIVGNCEYAMVFYRDKLPKFNNRGKMVFNCLDWHKDTAPKLHPTQKPQPVLKRLIEIFTDEGDVVIDPVAGSGSTLVAANSIHRKAYGFEIQRDLYEKAKKWIETQNNQSMLFDPAKTKYQNMLLEAKC
jgi:site-specific DNA-methyltransferase (adenine-specific)